MGSPFPGMDPYIEACGLWEDFHTHLIEKIYDALADAVPVRYEVRTGERPYIKLYTDDRLRFHSFRPDIGIVGNPVTGLLPQNGDAVALQ